MRKLLLLLLLTASFNSILAQISKPKANPAIRSKPTNEVKKDNRPIEVQNLVTEAYYVPPEFAADVLMRLAKSKKVVDKQWKKELVEAAFRFASEAKQSVRRKNANLGGYSTDTDVSYLSYAFGQNLDRLSLQNRAVRMMLELETQRAREMFNEIPAKISISPLSCDDALVYDVSDFYETLRLVTEKTFNSKQIKQGERIHFVVPYIEAISSHAQIVPALKLIVSLKPSLSESLIWIAAFTQVLKKIDGDDRSFSYELVRGGMLREIYQLSEILEEQEISAETLLKAYRTYLQKNLNYKRCADSAINDEGSLSSVLSAANSYFFKNIALTTDDVKPDEISGRAKIYEYWQSSEAKRLQILIRELRFGSKKQSLSEEDVDDARLLTEAEKQTSEWREQLNQFLIELENWNEEDERSTVDYFHQKQVLYIGLVEIVPDSPTRKLVLRSWIKSLNDGNIEKQNQIEWRWYAGYLLKLIAKQSNEEQGKIFEMLTSSKSSSLVLYAKLNQQQL